MPQYQEKTRVRRIERLSEENVRLHLYAPRIAAAARAGQFVMVKVSSDFDPLLRRPFSIHQVDGKGCIQLYFKIVGKGTACLASARDNAEFSVLGPLGRGFRIPEDAPVCLVGGGLGIAPMAFLAQEISSNKKNHSDDLIILGGRTASDVAPLLEDFEHYAMPVLASTDDGSCGTQGTVIDILKRRTFSEQTVVFCCGPEPMMAAVHQYCEERGLECQVSVETGMACGMGACLGCNRLAKDGNYVHVCMDGPVFDGKKLQWEW